MSDSPREILERWELCGGTWRIRSISADDAEIDLCTCHGDPVDRLASSDPAFVRLVHGRRRGEDITRPAR